MEGSRHNKTKKHKAQIIFSFYLSLIIGVAMIFSALWYTNSVLLFGIKDSINSVKGTLIISVNSKIKSITSEDHIRGDKDKAEVFLIEYSDVFCPACAQMRETIRKEYNSRNKDLAWVYRHFPLSTHHPFAYRPAIGSECVAEIKGNDDFWRYVDTLFEIEKREKVTTEIVEREAVSLGISEQEFERCIVKRKHQARVFDERLEAFSAGAIGTPFIILVNRNGEVKTLRGGAIQQKILAGFIDSLL
ncbi:MAG: thioredoxin domain-containing protein [Candidatus Campbellbacteria bacterium]|nr:thioredoxin domain-containing protein [Candidatus Campbellbacteria bacterium]